MLSFHKWLLRLISLITIAMALAALNGMDFLSHIMGG